jgi:Protein of unknown function (DUF1194)
MRKTLLCMTSALMLIAAAAQSSACVDVALVLAVDGSGSINDEEYAFQKSAIAAAFRDNAVLSAMRNAGVVAVSAVFWGDGDLPSQSLGWFVIESGVGAEPFAREIENNQRIVSGLTGLGSGIWWALDLLSDPRLCAIRSIVDVSGDGRETLELRPAISLDQARRRAEQMGVTINALVISDDGWDLAGYYAKYVILGAGAFVMNINKYTDYSVAIRKKLIKELAVGSRDIWWHLLPNNAVLHL